MNWLAVRLEHGGRAWLNCDHVMLVRETTGIEETALHPAHAIMFCDGALLFVAMDYGEVGSALRGIPLAAWRNDGRDDGPH